MARCDFAGFSFRKGREMKKNIARKMMTVGVLSVLLGLSVHAELGLAQILSTEGTKAVGFAVKAAAEAIYSSSDDPEVIQGQLTDLLNEAVATGDEQAVRYTIVAVMMAGGVENLETGKAAIDNSNALIEFPELTAMTVDAVMEMLNVTEGDLGSGGESGGAESGGDELGGGELGGGDVDMDDLFAPDIKDFDIDATQV